MIVAFTGTQRGLTPPQRERLGVLLADHRRYNPSPLTLLHGDCVGADAEAAILARDRGWLVEAYPCTIAIKRAYVGGHVIHEPAPPIARNHMMVDRCDVLIACPGEAIEQLRSGTWATIRYARKRGRPLDVIYPNGGVSA